MTQVVLLALKVAILLLILGIGMSSTLRDIFYLFRYPGQLARAIAAMYLMVPLAALVIVKIVTLPLGVEAALLVLAVSAGGLLLPKRLMDVSKGPYVLSLTFVSTLLAIVTVPLWIVVLSPIFGDSTELLPRDVALVLAKTFLAPLGVGILGRRFFPEIGKRVAERLLEVGGALLTVGFVVLLVLHGSKVLDAGWQAVLALFVMAAIALAIGHFMGGPDEGNRSVLAVCCSTRHVGIAVLVAAALPGPGTAALVIAYLLASIAVTVPYLHWRQKSAAKQILQ